MKKRIICMLLAIAMIAGILPTTANAAYTETKDFFEVTADVTCKTCENAYVSDLLDLGYTKRGTTYSVQPTVCIRCNCSKYMQRLTASSPLYINVNDCTRGTVYETTLDLSHYSIELTFTVSAREHTADEVITQNATCTAEGMKYIAACSLCDVEVVLETYPIDPNAHAADTEWTTDGRQHYHACTNGCGAKLDATNHSWENGVCTVCEYVCVHSYRNGECSVCDVVCTHEYKLTDTIIEPGCSHEGVGTYTCSICAHSYTGAIPVTHGDIVVGGDNGDGTHKMSCELCGDVMEYVPHTYEHGYCSVCGTMVPNPVAEISKNGVVTGYYADLQEALNTLIYADSEDAAVLKLLSNVDLGSKVLGLDVTYCEGFTLDLNGKVISNSNSDGLLRLNSTIYLGETTVVTIMDSGTGGALRASKGNAVLTNIETLILNGGTFSGGSYAVSMRVGDCVVNNAVIEGLYLQHVEATINEGTITSTLGKSAIYIYGSDDTLTGAIASLTINGGAISGDSADLNFEGKTTCTINGGSFPGGIEVQNKYLSNILGSGKAYWKGGTQLSVTNIQRAIKGDVTVKDICDHSQYEAYSYTDNEDNETHTFYRSCCNNTAVEAHTWGEDNFCELCYAGKPFTYYFVDGEKLLFTEEVNTGVFHEFKTAADKNGLTFLGWDADSDGKADYAGYNLARYIYADGGEKTFTAVYGDLCLIRYYVINTDTGEYKIQDIWEQPVGAPVNLNYDYAYDYTALGWATEPGGEKVYGYGQEITVTGTMNLYTVWEPFTVAFDLDGGSWLDENGNAVPETLTENKDFYTVPTKSGYKFLHFVGEDQYGSEIIYEFYTDEDGETWMSIFINGTMTLTAVWEECTAHNYENSVCTICGKVCEHEYDRGECIECGKVCEHEYENGHCTICDEMCEHGFVDGICAVCGMECDHTFDDEGVCTVCGMECDHTFDDEGVCTVCGTVCEHADQTGETCLVCGAALHIHTPDDRGQTCKGYWCTGCEEWYGEANPNAHNYVGKVTAEPTCDTAGMMTYTCGSCGDTYTEEIPAYHNNNLEYHPEKDPIDCATPGNNEYWYCPGCYEYFADAYAEEYINPWYIDVTVECARPEGLADCAKFICEICETENWGYGEHDVLGCKGGTCSKCREEIEGFGCQNYDTPACEDGLCYYCGGFVAGFGHENGAWAPCTDGKCSYGCGLAYPATEDHVDEDSDDYCDNCWNHLYHVAPDEDEYDPCSGYDCLICWAWVDGQHTGGEATCQSGPICEVCSTEYGEPDPDNHAEGCSCVIEETTVTVDFYSLSLKGNIGVNFYMDIPESIAADETGYMAFTTPRGGEVKIPIAQADVRTVDGKKYYRFTATVAAKEMTDVITGQYFYGEGQSEVFSYSVQQYAQQVIDYEGTDGNMLKLKPLAEAMLNYGAWAQKNFGYNTDKLAAEVSAIDSVTVDTLSGYARTDAQGTAAAPLESVSLILETETSMRLYFTTTAELTATMNGEALKVVRKSAGECYVEIPNISAKNLDDTFTIVIHDGTEEATVTYCPMTYCYNVLVAGTAVVSEDMVNTAKALYLYNQAANIYFQ